MAETVEKQTQRHRALADAARGTVAGDARQRRQCGRKQLEQCIAGEGSAEQMPDAQLAQPNRERWVRERVREYVDDLTRRDAKRLDELKRPHRHLRQTVAEHQYGRLMDGYGVGKDPSRAHLGHHLNRPLLVEKAANRITVEKAVRRHQDRWTP